MRDTFRREIDYLRLSVTDFCNYRCIYCMPEEGIPRRPHGDILRVEEIAELARAAVDCGVKKIRLTGGEPLVRHGILDICRELGDIPGLETLCMTTNGALLPQYAAALRDAGVSRLNLSLDTLDPARFRALTRRGDLADALDGLHAALDAGFDRVKVNAVLLRGMEDSDIRALIGLTADPGVDMRFIELMPMGPCAPYHRAHALDADAVLRACPELAPDGIDGVSECYRLPGHPGRVGLIRPMSHPFCARCSRIRIDSTGVLHPCLHGPEAVPLRGLHGDALCAAIRAGIDKKPMAHDLPRHDSRLGRAMSQIGG